MRILDLPEHYRPREKAMYYGFSSLTNQELLAILIGSGVKNNSALDIASSLLKTCGTLDSLSKASVKNLTVLTGLSDARAIKIIAAFELLKRIEIERSENNISLSETSLIYERYKKYFYDKKQEELIVISVSKNGSLKKSAVLYRGTNKEISISFKEVIAEVLMSGESDFYIVHNHVDGLVYPSKEDIILTRCLRKECKKLELNLIDHCIVGNGRYFSFKENNM